jgi:hypothetical protein
MDDLAAQLWFFRLRVRCAHFSRPSAAREAAVLLNLSDPISLVAQVKLRTG